MTRDYTRDELLHQAEAARTLVAELASDDDNLLHDMVEGETGLFEAVERALDEITQCEVVVKGCADMVAKLGERSSSAKARIERLRSLIDQAFQIAEIKSHKFPTATITQKATPPKVVVSDESQIPSRFFKVPPPKLDNSAVLLALKDGEDIPGASLSNGGTTIQIRRT